MRSSSLPRERGPAVTVPPTTVPTHELTNAAQQHALDTLTDARARGRAAHTRAAEHQVIQTHLSFAAALARRYHGRGADSEDLMQLARLGLVKAVKRWDPGTGAAFIPYAYPTILGELKRYFRDRSTIIRAPRGLRELHSETELFAADMEQRLGRPATDEELADAVGADVHQIGRQRAAVSGAQALSLDTTAVQAVIDRMPSELGHIDL